MSSESTTKKRILAFDVGIKNLAWCCAEISGSGAERKTTILGWSNENLATGGTAETDAAANRCSSCEKKAAYWHTSSGKGYCSRHTPPLTPALRDLSGVLLKKIPKMPVLRALAVAANAQKGDLKTKVAVQTFLEQRYCLPKPPAVQVKKLELEEIHNAMQDMVSKNAELWSGCTEILLENQPVFKNPVMKSVQMMLFATLRDLLEGPPKLRLVHAGRKTVGATGGDEGYAERKSASEERVLASFRSSVLIYPGKGATWFQAQTKKSDLADCCCMVLDCPAAPSA